MNDVPIYLPAYLMGVFVAAVGIWAAWGLRKKPHDREVSDRKARNRPA